MQITPAFKCSGVWPRSGAHWPLPHIPWPHPNLVAEVKTEGFDLLSKVARLHKPIMSVALYLPSNTVAGVPEPDREAVRHGGRRVGDLVPGGGEPAADRGVQEKEPLHSQDTAGPGMRLHEKGLC